MQDEEPPKDELAASPDAAGDRLSPLPRRRYKLTVTYDGSGFRGWQRQNPPNAPAPRTVCGVMEEAMQRALQQPVTLVGASRTDAGVHALGQVAHFDAATPIPVERLALAINARLPEDVQIQKVEAAAADFDAIAGARAKQYRYRIWNSRHKPLGVRHLFWHCWYEFDLARMQEAARRVVGEHDFEGFAAADHDRMTTVRTVFDCRVEVGACGGGEEGGAGAASPVPFLPGGSQVLDIVVQGSGFLYNMVRIIAGTLVEIGRGHDEPELVDRVLATRDRRLAGPTLPPHGLYLEWIRYADSPGSDS